MFGFDQHNRKHRLVRLTGKIICATKADEAAVDAVVNQPELFSGVQARIAAKQRSRATVESRRSWFSFSPVALRVAFAGVAMIVLLATAFLLLWQKDRPQPELDLADIETPLPVPPPPVTFTTGDSSKTVKRDEPQRKIRRQPLRRNEIVSSFIPLTYLADSTAVESGLIVRVRVPRSMLTRMGLPISAEISEDTVLADVALGDDGLARAIRFVN